MTNETHIVIADRFVNFSAASDNVMTETKVIDRILSDSFDSLRVRLILEHGVDVSHIRRAVSQADAEDRYDIVLGGSQPLAPRRLAHKANRSNILVSYPRRIDETRFELDVVHSPDSEFFTDHMTGMHIQGMAIIEAARQSFLAVTEAFYLGDTAGRYYFVIQNFNSNFLSFLFPLEATLEYEIRSYAAKAERHAFDVVVKVRQNDVICAEFAISFTAFPEERIAAKELEKAREAVARRLEDASFDMPAPIPATYGGYAAFAAS